MNKEKKPEDYPEFDDYAQSYGAGMDNSLKSKLGNSADDFLLVKLDWLKNRFPTLVQDANTQVLDFGCGTGSLLRVMSKLKWPVSKTGCDISEAMLAQAREVWPEDQKGDTPDFVVQKNAKTPFNANSFDLVIISAVLHHIDVDKRDATFREIFRILKPGGHIIVFEHNTYNPITRFVVARTPIDKYAILLPATETRARLELTGFEKSKTNYIMFAPPKAEFLRRIDRILGWLPLGGQYAMFAQKPLKTQS